MGSPGRRVVCDMLPNLRRLLKLDFVVANGENAAGGFGITPAVCQDLFAAGVDVITTGNHAWDQREIIPHFDTETRLLRPANYPPGTPGAGARVFKAGNGKRVLVVNVMCRLFMEALDDPFAALDQALSSYRLGRDIDAAVIDVHGEASSEKQALGRFADGRASLVVGSHTHTPTADTVILGRGTAYQTDAGMCGNYDSVIGGDPDLWIQRMRTKLPVGRVLPAKGDGTLCAVFAELNDKTGLAKRVSPVIRGPRLLERWPD